MRGKESGRRVKNPQVKARPFLQWTTLWDFPSQNYGVGWQGSTNYRGATPSYLIWNVLKRFTTKNQLVLDPMCGSGTTLDVAISLERRAIGYDLAPARPDVKKADARHLPLGAASVDFVFIDPPYSDHISYSDEPNCIGKLSATQPAYYEAMAQVIAEMHRVLKPNRYVAMYVSDSYKDQEGFCPIGFELFSRLRQHFVPIDIISVVRHSRGLKDANQKGTQHPDYLLRGFNYLFILQKKA